VMDSAAAQHEFGLEPTPWATVLSNLLRSYGWSGPGEFSDSGALDL
jgi:hypothetical protein